MDFKRVWEELDKIIRKLAGKNNLYNFVVVLLVGILILIVSSFFKTEKSASAELASEAARTVQTAQYERLNYEASMKNELKQMLGNMQGVGRVDVMIYFESGEEQIPAVNINNSTSTINEKDNQGGERKTTQSSNGSSVVTTNKGNNNEPFIVKTYKPKITGVMIVAEGAEDKQIQYDIIGAVSDLFNIPKSKVKVFSMKK